MNPFVGGQTSHLHDKVRPEDQHGGGQDGQQVERVVPEKSVPQKQNLRGVAGLRETHPHRGQAHIPSP